MAIVRMISRDLEEFRNFQADMVPLGRIRTGVFATPAGKRGRPEKLDRFRFTSPHRDLIEAVAAEYGGEARPWSPSNDPNRKEWEVISDADELDVLLINGQRVDPTYEAWAAGRTCVRRCDGVWDVISQAACLCNGPDKPADPMKLCKITTRVKVMLRRVPGVGSWMYESHGENFAIENGGLTAAMIAQAPQPIRSILRLELERRREPDREKGGFRTKEFYVARFYTTAATPQQALTGGDSLRQAITAAPVAAIEAPQTGAGFVPQPVVDAPQPAVTVEVSPVMLVKILGSIEACTTVEDLGKVKERLKARGITDQRVRDAWSSKRAGILAAERIAQGGGHRDEVTRERLREEAQDLANDPADRAEVRAIQDFMSGLAFPTPEEAEAAGSSCCGGFRAPDDTWSPCGGGECPIIEARAQYADVTLPPDEVGQLDTRSRYRVGVTGSRTWTDEGAIYGTLDGELQENPHMVLVHGDCPTGADDIADNWAHNRGVDVERHPADWDGPDGRGAGFARNLVIAQSGLDRMHAFIHNASKGATHCAAAADAAGVEVVRHVDETPIERTVPKLHTPLPGSTITDPREAALMGGRAFFDDELPQYDEAVQRGATHRAIVEAGGPVHWLAIDDQNQAEMVNRQFSDDLDAAISGTVEDPPTGTVVLPLLPIGGGPYDTDEIYASLMTGASRQTPPLTTAEVNALICRGVGVGLAGHATGLQLARLRAGLKAGTVAWR